MPRPPGLPKTGGRKPGTPNKKSKIISECLDAAGINLVSSIAEILPQLSVEKRVDVLMGLMPYVYPRKKSLESSLNVQGLELSTEEISKLRISQKIERMPPDQVEKRIKELRAMKRKTAKQPDVSF